MDSRSSLPLGLLIPSQFLPFTVSQQLRHSVGRIMEPVNLRAFHAINTGQRFIALAVAVNVGQRDPVVDFLQQAVAFPHKARRDGVARRPAL